MNQTKNIVLLFCGFLSCIHVFAQDSLKNAYYKASSYDEKMRSGLAYLDELRFEDPDRAISICDSLIKEEQGKKSIRYLGLLYEQEGGAAWHKGDLKTSTNCYKQSYYYHYKNNEPKEVASALNNIAYNYFESGNYTEALKYLSKAWQIGKKLNDEELLSITNTYLGQVNVKLKEYARGIAAYKQTLAYFEAKKKFRNQAIVYNNIGTAFLEQNMHDSAVYWFDRSLQLNMTKNNQNGIALSLSNKGLVYIEQKKYKLAEEALLKAYKKYDSLKSDLSIVLVCSNIARLYTETNKPDDAIVYAKKAEALATDVASFEQLVSVYNMLSNLYNQKGDHKKAFEYSRLELKFSDSLANENAQQIQNELATRFETEGLNDKIELLNNTNKLKDAEIEKKRARQNLYLVLALAAVAIAASLLYLFISQRKTKRKLESKNVIIENSLQEREVLLKEIHHRVKNNLQIISSLLSLQGGYGNAISTDELVQQSESRIKSMALIHEMLYQSENLKEIDLSEYVRSFMEQLSNILFFKEKGIVYSVVVEPMHIDIDRLVPLGLILNEVITNAIKHAFKNKESGELKVSGKTEGTIFIISITDNGGGMPPDFSLAKSRSLGIRLINGLANQIKATLSVESQPGNTAFSIQLPLK